MAGEGYVGRGVEASEEWFEVWQQSREYLCMCGCRVCARVGKKEFPSPGLEPGSRG